MYRYQRITESDYALALQSLDSFGSSLAYQKPPDDLDLNLPEVDMGSNLPTTPPSSDDADPNEKEFSIEKEEIPELPPDGAG